MSQREKPVKVAYLLDAFPVLSETFILNEIAELKKLGLDVAVFSFSKPNKGAAHKEGEELAKETCYFATSKLNKVSGMCVYVYVHLYLLISAPFRYLKTFWFAYALGKYKYVFSRFRTAAYFAFVLQKNSKTSHIHAHFASSASEYAMLISMLTGIPFSFTIHAYDIFREFRLIREKIDLAKFVVVISSYNKKFIKERCPTINEGKIHVIHCGVDLKKLAAFGSNGDRSKQPFVILSVGRLVEKKGHKYLLEACSILTKRGVSQFICKIIGDGPLKRELEGLALSLSLSDHVQFVGAFPSSRVLSALKESDLFVLPCVVAEDGDMDGIPVSLIEAMALQKPVISTYVSGIPELIRDGSGILVPPGDSENLAKAIGEIYSMDVERKERMLRKGWEIVDREFNIEKEAKKLKNLFTAHLEASNKTSSWYCIKE